MAKKKSAKRSNPKSKSKAASKTAKARKANHAGKDNGKKWKFGGVVVKAIAGAALFQSFALGKSY